MAKKKLTVKDIEHISIRDLAYKLKEVDDYIANPKSEEARDDRKPSLAFFLGAGASKDSGVLLASDMMTMFREKIFEVHCPDHETDEQKSGWLKEQQSWYEVGKKEYGCLFKKFRDTKRGRQRFIEEICRRNPLTGKLVEPSFGYVVLADLLLRNYANTVITTNFDDLVYIAATTFTGNRPIVYAYGILASEMKISDSHSRVLKLHGDFLYSNIVNTDDEMSVKSDAISKPVKDARAIISDLNMEHQVRTVLDNFGLIVIGYAGGDATITNLLEQVSENNGFYWCYVKDYPPDADVLELVQSKGGKLIEITGFDDLMNGISEITGFSLDDLLASFDRRKENLVGHITKFKENSAKKSLVYYADKLTEKQKDKPSETLSAVDYFVLGDKAYDERNFAFAEENYRKAIELNPAYADAYINLGNSLFQDENRQRETEEYYRKAIELNPIEAIAYNNLGSLHFKQEKYREAEENYRKAFELNPSYADAYNNLGNLLAEDETRKKEAEEIYQKAIEINPNYADAYTNLGILLSNDETRQKEVEESYRKAIEANPNYAAAHINLGNLLLRDENRWKDAEVYYRRAIDLNPEDGITYNNLGVVLNKRNKLDEAIEVFQTSAKLGANYVSPRVALAGIYKRLGKPEEAKKYSDEAFAIIKDDDYYALACLNSLLGKKDEVFKYLKLAISDDWATKIDARSDPDFEWLHDDKGFWEIVGKDDE